MQLKGIVAKAAPRLSLDTSKLTDFSRMGHYDRLGSSIPLFDTSNGTNFEEMFSNCVKITTIPLFDTSNGTDFSKMFYYTQTIKSIPKLNTNKGTKFTSMFLWCSQLESVSLTYLKSDSNIFGSCTALKDVDIDRIKVNSNSLKFNSSASLTVESMLNIMNAFDDNTGGTQYTVYFGSQNLDNLTANQKAIATNKNIKLA